MKCFYDIGNSSLRYREIKSTLIDLSITLLYVLLYIVILINVYNINKMLIEYEKSYLFYHQTCTYNIIFIIISGCVI